jgi:hypothetical protein
MNEKLWPYVYLDIDETLIFTECSHSEPAARLGEFKFKLGSYWYYTNVRPCALDLIKFCRNISICRILTAATRDYTELICNHFGFNFDSEEIITRDEYVEWVPDEYSGFMGGALETARARGCIGHVNAILVDNQQMDMPNARIKREYLGMPWQRYIEFPEWHGGPELKGFDEQYESIKLKIKSLVEEVAQA